MTYASGVKIRGEAGGVNRLREVSSWPLSSSRPVIYFGFDIHCKFSDLVASLREKRRFFSCGSPIFFGPFWAQMTQNGLSALARIGRGSRPRHIKVFRQLQPVGGWFETPSRHLPTGCSRAKSLMG